MSLIDNITNRLFADRIASIVDQRLSDAFNIEVKSNPANSAITNFLSGFPAPQRNIPSLDSDLYRVATWVYTGVSRVADSLIEVPLEPRLYDKGGEYETITEGEIFKVFDPPNPDMAWEEFIAKSACDMLLCGGAKWTIIPGPKDPWEVYHMLARYMFPVVGRGNDILSHYEYKEGGKTIRYEREEVIDIRMPNPNDHFYGQSAIQPTRGAIQLYEAVQSLFSDFFKNVPFFGMAFLTEGPVGPDSNKKFKDDLKNKYSKGEDGNGGGRFDPLVLNKVTPVSLSQGLNTIQYDVVTERSIMAILAAIGTPPALVGLLKHANYSNMDAQMKIFWRNRLKPMMKYIEAAINLRMSVLFNNPMLRWEFNTNSVDALQDDKGEVATRATTIFTGGISRLDEARKSVGLPPEEDPELGAMYNWQLPRPAGIFDSFDSFDSFGSDPNQSEEQYPDPEDETVEGSSTNQARPPGTDLRTPVRAADYGDLSLINNPHYLKSAAVIRRKTPTFAKLMKGFFIGQLDRVIEKYNALTNDGKLLTPLHRFTKDIPDNAEDLFNRALEAELLRQYTDPYIRELVRQEVKRAVASLGIEESFNVTNPRVVKFIENGINKMATDVTASTWKKVQGVLTEGYGSGSTSVEIRDSLTELFESWYKPAKGQVGVADRCMRISRTEMGKFVHGGQFQAYQEAVSGYGLNLQKIWIHSHKADGRPEHAILDGMVIPFNDKFNVAGFMADYPNDPNLPADQVVNCGCDYIVQEIE